MKKICFILLIGVFSAPVFSQQLAVINLIPSNVATPDFLWAQTTYDFGKIAVNKPVTHEFRFTNSGDAPLVITSVQAACGCTVTAYSKEPIAPGSEGYVKATYNAAKLGMFSKAITVNANAAEGMVQLIIRGEVVE